MSSVTKENFLYVSSGNIVVIFVVVIVIIVVLIFCFSFLQVFYIISVLRTKSRTYIRLKGAMRRGKKRKTP